MFEPKEFKEFKAEFLKWQAKFGLNGYRVSFKYEPLESCYAQIVVQQNDMIAMVSLDSSDTGREFMNVKQSAKHEAIHLLLYRLEARAVERFSTQNDIYEACEEIVHKLEKLIGDK